MDLVPKIWSCKSLTKKSKKWNVQMTTVCSYHVMNTFQSVSTLYSCLNIKELLARSRHEIWGLSDNNWTRTYNHLAKRTLNHLAKLDNHLDNFKKSAEVDLLRMVMWLAWTSSFPWMTKRLGVIGQLLWLAHYTLQTHFAPPYHSWTCSEEKFLKAF